MTATQTVGSIFGASVKRREDPRLVTGRGQFVDDLKIPGTVHAAFVRSPHAHARITSIDVRSAQAAAVLTDRPPRGGSPRL